MPDSLTIQSIADDQMIIVLNLSGQSVQQVLPFLSREDAGKLTQQLQSFAQEMRDEFAALKAAVLAEAASQPQGIAPVSDAVNALIGQEIPVDTTGVASAVPSAQVAPANGV